MSDGDGPNEYDPPRRSAKGKGISPLMWVGVGVGGFLLLGCCVFGSILAFWFLQGMKEGPRKYTPMTTDQLIDEWKKNPQAAAAKYKDVGVEITGRLHAIDSNMTGQTYIDVRGAGEDRKRSTHIFVLDARAKDGLKKCTVGTSVVVKARAEGSAQDVPWMVADDVTPAN